MIIKVNWKILCGYISIRATEETQNQSLFPSIIFFFQNKIAVDPVGEHNICISSKFNQCNCLLMFYKNITLAMMTSHFKSYIGYYFSVAPFERNSFTGH